MPEGNNSDLAKRGADSLHKRSHQVKVTLNPAELESLDKIVEKMGSDRSSVFRKLLKSITTEGVNIEKTFEINKDKSSINEGIELEEIYDEEGISQTSIVHIFEPRVFDEMPRVIRELKMGSIVILNLTMMETEQAQRAVDFVAGGTFFGDGHQERIGECIFLFAPPKTKVLATFLEERTPKVGEDNKSLVNPTIVFDASSVEGKVLEASITEELSINDSTEKKQEVIKEENSSEG